MRKAFCICENKGTDQLRVNCATDQCLCFCYIISTIPLLSESKISSLEPSYVVVQLGLCLKQVFSRCGSKNCAQTPLQSSLTFQPQVTPMQSFQEVFDSPYKAILINQEMNALR